MTTDSFDYAAHLRKLTEAYAARCDEVAAQLHAAAAPTQLHAAATAIDVPATGSRELSGLVLPFGEIGYTDIGPVEVAPDATIVWPDELDRVKLFPVHTSQDPKVEPIGYLTAARQTPDGWRASFHLPADNPESDRALQLAAPDANGKRLKDGFSVELVALGFNARGQLSYAEVSATAHVPIPAFPSARHDGMAASLSTTRQEGNTVNPLTDDERNRLRELLAVAPADRTPEQNTEAAELLARATVDELAELTAPQPEAAQDPAPAAAAAGAQPQLAAASARAPRMPGRATPAGRRTPQLRELFAAQARVMSGRSRAELEAALLDITAGDNLWTAQDDYAGQLWSGLVYERQYVGNSTPGELTSYKGTGWRWVTKPEVADYAGDKAAVPSNQPETEDSPWTAARLAGAHDLDRKFWDFGDEEFIAAYYEAMRESYAMKSDAKALAFQLASATAIATAETSLFRAAAVAAQGVETATNGKVPDFFYINSTDKLGLLDITDADVPAYLSVFGVTPEKFKAAPGVAAGTVVAGVKEATRFRELSSSPIRVEAINIANGGVDGGVFGYYATELILPGGIQSKTFA